MSQKSNGWVLPYDRGLLSRYAPHVLEGVGGAVFVGAESQSAPGLDICHTDRACPALGTDESTTAPGETAIWAPCTKCADGQTAEELFDRVGKVLVTVRAAEDLEQVPDLLAGSADDLEAAAHILGVATNQARQGNWAEHFVTDVYEQVYGRLRQLREQFRTVWAPQHSINLEAQPDDVHLWLTAPASALYEEDGQPMLRATALACGLDLPSTRIEGWTDTYMNVLGGSGDRPSLIVAGVMMRLPRKFVSSRPWWLQKWIKNDCMVLLGDAVDPAVEPTFVSLFNQELFRASSALEDPARIRRIAVGSRLMVGLIPAR